LVTESGDVSTVEVDVLLTTVAGWYSGRPSAPGVLAAAEVSWAGDADAVAEEFAAGAWLAGAVAVTVVVGEAASPLLTPQAANPTATSPAATTAADVLMPACFLILITATSFLMSGRAGNECHYGDGRSLRARSNRGIY
jgi:hypothetical protein